MQSSFIKRLLTLLGLIFGLWLGIEYILPLILPMVLGGVIALAAEPLVRLCQKRMPRFLASGIGVTATLVLTGAIVSIAGALLFRQALEFARKLPDLQQTATEGGQKLLKLLDALEKRTPAGLRPMVRKAVQTSFEDTSQLMDQMTHRLTAAVTGKLTVLPRGALTLATGVLAGFMISGRLPRLTAKLPQSWKTRYIPVLRHIQSALSGWLKAELKLCAITWACLSLGFALLKIPRGILWAALIALVDAVPVLGTGAVLVPWAIWSFIQGQSYRGIGLLLLWGTALTVRTVMEPRLVGHQLGLDPLVTLAAFYAGFRLWGIGGMLLAPVLATAVKAALPSEK